MNTVLITGATSGIGWQLAHDYHEKGWQVIACGRNEERLLQLKQLGLQTFAFDLEHPHSIHQHLNLAAITKLDCLILNAGTCEYVDEGQITGPLMERTFNINVVSQMSLLELLLPLLKKSAGAQLVLVSSASVYLPFVRAEAYGASKAAIRYLGQVLSNSLKPYGIDVSTVILGFIDTPLTQKNNFAMPALAQPKEASQAIIKGVSARKTQILFPYWFCRVLNILERLPVGLKLKIAARLAA